MEYTKEDIDRLINVEKLSYIKIGKLYGVSDTYIKKVAIKLGVELPIRAVFPKGFNPRKKSKINYCLNCKKELSKINSKYCNNKCQQQYQSDNNYKFYLENQELYNNRITSLSSFKPRFLIEQDFKCNICSIPNYWNGKELTLVLDHIDGNASNNIRSNLRLICSNCDSQLPTFKSRNKNSARKDRYLKNYKKEKVENPRITE